MLQTSINVTNNYKIFYLLRLLLLIAVTLATSPLYAQAIYRGKVYNSRVCNSPNCAMCNMIQAQLMAPTPQKITPVAAAYEPSYVPVSSTSYESSPTPYDAVSAMVSVADPGPDDVLYDLGCGDGRILITAASSRKCRAVGVEINGEAVQVARGAARLFKLDNRIRIYQGDILNFKYPEATVVTVYLYPDLIQQVLSKLPRGCRIVSYLHEFPGSTKTVVNGHVFWVGTVE